MKGKQFKRDLIMQKTTNTHIKILLENQGKINANRQNEINKANKSKFDCDKFKT